MAIGSFNIRDPRFQRDMQRARSKASMRGGRLSRSTESAVAAGHAGHQFSRGLVFQQLGLASEFAKQRFDMAKTRIAQADKERGLRKKDLRFRKNIFEDQLDQRKQNLRYTIGLGLGTAGLSFLEGKRRASALEEERLRRNKADKRQLKLLENQAALISKLGASL